MLTWHDVMSGYVKTSPRFRPEYAIGVRELRGKHLVLRTHELHLGGGRAVSSAGDSGEEAQVGEGVVRLSVSCRSEHLQSKN